MSNSQFTGPADEGFTIPSDWTHYGLPLHALLSEQRGRCGLCEAPASFRRSTDGLMLCNLVQWVEDGLLLGLVCPTCKSRYIWRGSEPPEELRSAYHQFRGDPPGQRCEATRGHGRQVRPRRLRRIDDPVEEPGIGWRMYGSVSHVLFNYQRGVCAVCATGLTVSSNPRAVHVDHDHVSGLLRGLLCHRCNIALGQPWPDTFWEDLAPVKNAYLANPPAQRLSDTKGLWMKDRYRPAAISLSEDGTHVMLGTMPLLGVPAIGEDEPAELDARASHFALRYDRETTFPRVVMAHRVVREIRPEGTWLKFVLDVLGDEPEPVSLSVWEVLDSQVEGVSEHVEPAAAWAAAWGA